MRVNGAAETQRIIRNIAIWLNEHKEVFPPNTAPMIKGADILLLLHPQITLLLTFIIGCVLFVTLVI